jgi:hypothetical protein
LPLCLCGVARPSRGDCSPLGWILVPLVGCISLDITWEWQLELAAVGATFALRLISLLVYVDIELSASLMVVLEGADLLRLP